MKKFIIISLLFVHTAIGIAQSHQFNWNKNGFSMTEYVGDENELGMSKIVDYKEIYEGKKIYCFTLLYRIIDGFLPVTIKKLYEKYGDSFSASWEIILKDKSQLLFKDQKIKVRGYVLGYYYLEFNINCEVNDFIKLIKSDIESIKFSNIFDDDLPFNNFHSANTLMKMHYNLWQQYENREMLLSAWGWDANDLNGQMPEKKQSWMLDHKDGKLYQFNVHDGNVKYDYKIEGDIIRLTNRCCIETSTVDKDYNGWVKIILASPLLSGDREILTVDSYGVYRVFRTVNY